MATPNVHSTDLNDREPFNHIEGTMKCPPTMSTTDDEMLVPDDVRHGDQQSGEIGREESSDEDVQIIQLSNEFWSR